MPLTFFMMRRIVVREAYSIISRNLSSIKMIFPAMLPKNYTGMVIISRKPTLAVA